MLCPDDNTLAELMQGLLSAERRREVEQHMDVCATCSSVLTGVGRTFDRGQDLPSGNKLGRYEIIECIGRGAMGTVYSARDPLLARNVALKVLHHSDQTLREARALARLSHPNVVAIYDVGEEAGRVYIAMEIVSGTTLGTWQRESVRSWRAIVDVFLQAAQALAAAHAAGVVHGDFKPDNVIVGHDGRVRVTDFGLARLHSETDGAPTLAGTPAYMAPEQLEGARATPASDQFSLATAVHESLYGARPFAAPTIDELRALLRNPRTLAPPADPRGAPPWLFPIVAKGVAIDPRFRHASIDDFAKRIRRSLDGREVHYVINAILQLVMLVFHVSVTTLFVWALFSPDPPATSTPVVHRASEYGLGGVSTVIAVWLAMLFFVGWAPLGIVWAPINAYGLFRKRRWALTSSLIYAAFSLITCIGTPVGVYALVSLWPLRKRNNAT